MKISHFCIIWWTFSVYFSVSRIRHFYNSGTGSNYSFRDRAKIQPPPKLTEDTEYTPDLDRYNRRIIPAQPNVTVSNNQQQYESSDNSTWKTHYLQPKNVPPTGGNTPQGNTNSGPVTTRTVIPRPGPTINRIVQNRDGTLVSQNYAPYRVTPPARPLHNSPRPGSAGMPVQQTGGGPRATGGPRRPPANATNVRITKQVLESILHHPNQFTQINLDQPPELCNYLKV